MGEASTPVLEPVKAVEKPKTWRDISIVDHLKLSGGAAYEVASLESQMRAMHRSGVKPSRGFAYNIYSVISQSVKGKVTPMGVERFYEGLVE